jgi:peptidoglycan/xylan/chitin deacetylase (PgdA/CDA1 family)
MESGLNLVRRALRQTKTLWLESCYRRPVSIALNKPIASMTFDDVPLSAYQYGVPILRRHNVKGTFYVALGIKDEKGEQFLGPSQILDLYNDDHEIACHTYSHYRLSNGDIDGLRADAQKNRTLLAQLLNNSGPQNFSFPFGELSFAAKKKLQDSYQSLRTSRPGLNHGSTDLNCLKAYSLGASSATRAQITELLDKTEHKNGWLILYSHGVSPNPGPYDILPGTLEFILSECFRRRIEMLPVVRALQLISNP